MDKLGLIVPYRNRYDQLQTFKQEIVEYLEKKKINYELIIVEQDDAKQFNRGMLLNIGYQYAKKLECNYLVFHDVDMIPLRVDYSYSDVPLHMATDFILDSDEKKREVFHEYFGGVTMFPTETFEKINGYSNKYWGWGYEDTDLLLRCKFHNVKLDTLPQKNVGDNGSVLKFNGIDSYVKVKNIIDFNSNATFSVTFNPEKLVLNHEKQSDEFTIFSIPGWDFAICYNSFSRYNFCAFDSDHNALYVNSKIKTNYRTNITVTMNRNENYFSVYQDGIHIGTTDKFKRLYPYKKMEEFYLGVGNPERDGIPNYFNGTLVSFAYYDDILNDDEILEISNRKNELLTNNFGDYKSKNSLKLYYEASEIIDYELVDLTGNNNNGMIVNCEMTQEEIEDIKEVKIPFRRRSLFISLKHEENGFLGNKWKDQATRWNQLRFHNEVSNNHHLIFEDGLSDLEFVEYGLINEKNITQINIGI